MHKAKLMNINESKALAEHFNKVPLTATSVRYEGLADLKLGGGHLQGIQLYTYSKKNYAFLTGSTHVFSYLQIIEFSDKGNKIIATHRLSEGDLRHAGGFQIYDNYLAVGLEDNYRKNYALVNVYELGDPKNFDPTPLASIERKGKRKRNTAGCIGFTAYRNNYYLVVGDWNTRHLDFYVCEKSDWHQKKYIFRLQHSIAAKEMNRKNWSDRKWRSYQNINLFTDKQTDALYLLGMDGWYLGRDVADLFRVELSDTIHLEKVSSKKIRQQDGARFIWGGGAFLYEDGKLGLIACGYRSFGKRSLSLYRV